MSKISKFELVHGSGFERYSQLGGGTVKCSAIKKLADLIDSTWLYSVHWNTDEPTEELKARIKDDCNDELNTAKDRLEELQEAMRIIDSIEDD